MSNAVPIQGDQCLQILTYWLSENWKPITEIFRFSSSRISWSFIPSPFSYDQLDTCQQRTEKADRWAITKQKINA